MCIYKDEVNSWMEVVYISCRELYGDVYWEECWGVVEGLVFIKILIGNFFFELFGFDYEVFFVYCYVIW